VKAPASLRVRLLAAGVLWGCGALAAGSAVAAILVRRHLGGDLAGSPPTPRGSIDRWFLAHATLTIWTLGSAAAGLLAFGLSAMRGSVAALDRLRARMVPLRSGLATRLTGEYPTEIQPLVDDLNVLLAARDEAVTRAREEAGTLAHALKTPLSAIANEVSAAHGAPGGKAAGEAWHVVIGEQVRRMQGTVGVHLARARAAAGGRVGARADVRSTLTALRRALARLHPDREISVAGDGNGASPAFRGDRQDLEEMLGNLLDNACEWSTSRVQVSAILTGDRLLLDVDDDGPGLDSAARRQVLAHGTRLGADAPGAGLGLAIVRDVAALYGGGLTLAASPLGGLRARLDLPAAARGPST
jgi:signal transduction histidine kinase